MTLKSGEKVFFSTLPEAVRREATVLSAEGDAITLEVGAGEAIDAGSHLMISSGGQQYFAEVSGNSAGVVTLRQTWSNSREYFRIDDVVPLLVQRAKGDKSLHVPRAIPFFHAGVLDVEPPGTDVHPELWQMLVNIHTMLGMVLERLDLDTEGFLKAEKKHVTLSASGMRFGTPERYEAGEELEVRMLLPARPPFGALVYGTVLRMVDAGEGDPEIVLQFNDLGADLRDQIIQYALMRQRDILRQARE